MQHESLLSLLHLLEHLAVHLALFLFFWGKHIRILESISNVIVRQLRKKQKLNKNSETKSRTIGFNDFHHLCLTELYDDATLLNIR